MTPGFSATANAVALANLLLSPTIKLSKVYKLFKFELKIFGSNKTN